MSLTKHQNKVANEFQNELCRRIVVDMKGRNIPMTTAFSCDVLSMLTKTCTVYELIDWHNRKKDKEGDVWYLSIKNILRNEDEDHIYHSQLKFTFAAIKLKLMKAYLLHNITWR